ncbi:hypothetical protein NLI96_g3120 [Meripilus lineatus]|uniref:DUF6533 domain-containing protein n=1 Tax=Meripilus lineatus TaxID=2056292 RepID=A0AAD5V9F3_9APHY|nr:hypothetical protein NLI96_g3120 [Physisporinus lineatus]
MAPLNLEGSVDQVYMTVFGGALFYYDWFLTLPDEVRYVWFAPKTTGVWIYLINRYLTFFTDPAILLLRTYALYRCDKRVLAIMLAISSCLVAVGGWSIVNNETQVDIDQSNRCRWGLPESFETSRQTAPLLVTSLMQYFTFRIRFQGRRRNLGVINEIPEMMLRDGALYFGVMACSNAANVLTFFVSLVKLRSRIESHSNSFSLRRMQSTMISRLMLNIRQKTYDPGPSTYSLGSGLGFGPSPFDAGGPQSTTPDSEFESTDVEMSAVSGSSQGTGDQRC